MILISFDPRIIIKNLFTEAKPPHKEVKREGLISPGIDSKESTAPEPVF
jgi:hypothetical protein